MKAFAVSTFEHPNLYVLRHSAKVTGYDLNVLGLDFKGEWRNPLKLLILYETIRDLPPDEIIVFVDAFDSCFINRPSYLLRGFQYYHCDLLFSASPYCYPGAAASLYPPNHPRMYLNAGLICGRVGAFCALVERYRTRLADPSNKTEQALLHPIYWTHDLPLKMRIDTEGRALLNINKPTSRTLEINTKQKVVRCKQLGTTPGAISQPGIHRPRRFRAYFSFLERRFPTLDLEPNARAHADFLEKKWKRKVYCKATEDRVVALLLLVAALFGILAVACFAWRQEHF